MPHTPSLRALFGTLLIASALGAPASAQTKPPASSPISPVRSIIKSQHLRLTFPRDVQRLAVGDTDILAADLLTSREVLVLGRETGRTTLIVWFGDGTTQEYVFAVQRDLSLLESALKRLSPSIDVEIAPDRDAIVLSGVVPNLLISQTAEAYARSYLDAGNQRRGAAMPLLSVPGGAPVGGPGAAPPDVGAQPGQATSPTPAPSGPSGTAQLQGTVQPSGTIINLLRLETLPLLPEEKVQEAIQAIGGQNVTVRRMLKGSLRDDTKDTLVLEGRVPNQVALVRVLTLASQLFTGQTIAENDIRVIADESGGLTNQVQTQGQQPLSLGGTNSLFGGSRSTRLTNQVQRNLGRAKAIEAAGGRILSFIEVSDLPQIRVDIRLLEINRTKLRSFNPSSALLSSNFMQPSLNPAQSATVVQGDEAARVGGSSATVQDVLSFLSGGFLNQLQFNVGHVAVDLALSLLEREGIARSLSSPSLTVLSGESAQVQVGGEVPIPVAFTPSFGGTAANAPPATPGVFSSVEFVPFGVQLEIRPLVGDDDTITLDVQPLIVTPDAILTAAIRQTTGTPVATTAFQTRALRTSSRLQDGEVLLIGGLVSNNLSANTASTPGLRNAPLIGHLFQSSNGNDESTELVVVVNPVLLRTPVSNAALWAFPDRNELMRAVMKAGAAPPVRPQP